MTAKNKHIILKATNLSIGYKTKSKTAVIASNINFELQKGELIGLVGANGIGKSTLLRSLTKFQPHLSGTIHLNTKSIATLSEIVIAKQLSVVLTEPLVTKNLTVYELVSLGRQPYTNWIGALSETDKAIINQSLELVNLTDSKTKVCAELSDGQLQKVMIARALAQDTDVIILDEPTTHLDMYHKAYILKLLKTLAKDTQKTILFSSHEIDLAIQLCDKMLVMTETDLISGEPCQLIQNKVFDKLFPKDLIVFDESVGRFKVNKS